MGSIGQRHSGVIYLGQLAPEAGSESIVLGRLSNVALSSYSGFAPQNNTFRKKCLVANPRAESAVRAPGVG